MSLGFANRFNGFPGCLKGKPLKRFSEIRDVVAPG